ncbi:MAG: hypothetical protein ACI9LV_000556 [Candidatus Nanohaloarchaea archaeon]|jgi:hypothetical protein
MFPEKHVKEMERLESRKSFRRKIFASAVFLGSVFVIGPVIHELSHMVVLEAIDCKYVLEWGLNINGIHGSVRPVCVPTTSQLATFYSIGYLSTIMSGGYLSFVTLRNHNVSSLKMTGYTALGTGLLVSTAINLSTTGDITNLGEILEISTVNIQFFTTGLFLAISATVVRTLQISWSQQSEGEET